MLRIHLALLFFFAIAAPAIAEPIDLDALHPVGAITRVDRDAGGLTLHLSDASEVRVSAVTPDVIRVRASLGRALPRIDHSWAIVPVPRPSVAVTVAQDDGRVTFATSTMKVVMDRSPLRVHVFDKNGTLIDEDALPMQFDGKGTVAAVRPLGFEEHFYGLGDKTAQLDRRHCAFTMWNTDIAFNEGTDPIYQSIPFYIGLRRGAAFGLFFDNSWRSHFDFGHLQNEYVTFGAEGGEMDYYVIRGPSLREVVSRYADLTGHMPMLPRWVLGHQQSRYSYYPARLVEEVAEVYRRENLPLDAIHLDIHYMDAYRVFTWNPTRFPDPKAFIKRMHEMGVKIVTIVDPGVKYQPEGGYTPYDEGLKNGYFLKRRDGSLWIGKVWPGAAVYVDYTIEKARQWWGSLHRALTDAGVDGVWNDMNEPSNFLDQSGAKSTDVLSFDQGQYTPYLKNRNLFALLETRACYEGLLRLRPNRRPYLITRAAYAGVQRYATMWTGDNESSFDQLALTIPMLTSIGLSGEPFCGADVGGFHGRCNGELLTRWYEVAFLAPFCRNHKAIEEYDQEPWRFGQPYEDIIRRFLKLRYRLLPYLYTLLEEAHRTGAPIMRPVLWIDQDDPNLASVDDEFMLGDGLLAAPVLAAGRTERTLYLPHGVWYDWWRGQRVDGGRALTVPAPLDRVPLFARGGAMIPLGPEMNHVDEVPPDRLDVEIFPDANGHAEGTVYDDDGQSLDYLKGISRIQRMHTSRGIDGWAVHLDAAVGSYATKRRLRLHVHLPAGNVVSAEVADDGSARDVTIRGSL